MDRRVLGSVGCAVVTLGLVAGVTAPVTAAAGAAQDGARLAGRTVRVVSAPSNLTEGDRYPVVVKVGSAAKAKKVQIQTRTQDIYGTTVWETARTKKVRGHSRQKFTLVAGPTNPLRQRALVTYEDGQKVRSQAFRVTTWRWFDLPLFSSYYYTANTYSSRYATFTIAGSAYSGWFGGGTRETAWESRHTPGRHCTAFRGVAGVTDTSMDGSSAQITLVADETTVVYQSPTLMPGAAHPFEVSLARPYRIAVQARLTSTNRATPAIGAPQLLCDYATGEDPS